MIDRFFFKNKDKKILIIFVLFLISLTYASAAANNTANNTNYRIFIDDWKGFYKILNGLNESDIVNKTVTIKVGDTITFYNYAFPDRTFTVVSKKKLWKNNSAILKFNGKMFSYKFNKEGINNIFIKEFPHLTLTINVKSDKIVNEYATENRSEIVDVNNNDLNNGDVNETKTRDVNETKTDVNETTTTNGDIETEEINNETNKNVEVTKNPQKVTKEADSAFDTILSPNWNMETIVPRFGILIILFLAAYIINKK